MIRFVSILLLLFHFHLNAQVFTLQQCIDSALANNIRVKQGGLLSDVAQVNWQQAKANLFPNLGVAFNHGINQGRSIDPFTNTYVDQTVNYASYGLSSGVVLFNGLTLQNRLRQMATGYEASRMEWKQVRDNLTLTVIIAYLQVLNNEDVLLSAEQQLQVSKKQLERLEILDSKGAISPSQVSDLKGQLMNDQLSVNSASNQLETSKLSLLQLMNIPYTNSIRLQRIDVEQFADNYNKTAAEVYENSLHQLALLKVAEMKRQSAEYGLKAAKGQLYPGVLLGGNIQTNFSSAAEINNGKIPYGEQLTNNVFSGLNVGIRIPLFNNKEVRSRIKLADIELKNEQLLEENTKIELRQQVEKAYLDMNNARERYRLLVQQVDAYQQSFKAAEARFNAGLGSSVDFLIAKNNLDRATINLVSAKYDFAFRKKVLDYYEGK